MKKIFGLLAICALTLVGCNDTPEPEPIVKAPVVTLDKESVEAPVEGGTFSVNYTIENAQEGVTLNVVEDVEWISDVVASEGVITFTVAANDVEEQRDAVLNVEYKGAEARAIAVAQAAKDKEPEMPTIALEVSDITWNNAYISVTPSADVEYILGVMTKEAFAPYVEDPETLVAARIAEWQETAEQYIDMGYDDPWQYYMGYEQRSGERTYDVKYDDIYNMDWDTEYVAYCFGMNDEGVQTASVAVKEFRTTAPVPSNNTFTITIDAMTKSSVEFTVEPTTDEPYYVTIETIDVLAPYGPDKENSYEDLIKYLIPDYESTIEQRTFAGKQTITNSDLGKSVNGFKTYRVVVWGFENGPTT
ncbi:MAG: BACON domain-containing protein, partial [Alistipes sp.]|nr:BACON domain-containing protein [Alistipes sp.]